MTRAEALAILGLTEGHDAAAVRRAFRDRIRVSHPDLVGQDGGASARVAELTEAYRVLRSPAPQLPDHPVEPELHALHTPAGDPFMQLVDAADDLGHISYLDRHDRILQVVVETDDKPVCQLTVELDDGAASTRAAFTLVTLEGGAAPPIEEVVGRLQQILYARQRSNRARDGSRE